jgi:hypothetical protein
MVSVKNVLLICRQETAVRVDSYAAARSARSCSGIARRRLARCTAGSSMAIKIAMIVITTSNSIRVKPATQV